MKKRKEAVRKNLSIAESISNLQQKIEMFRECEIYAEYFLPISFSRLTYIVETRRQVAVYLMSVGANKSDLSKVFGQKPCTMIHLLNTNPGNEIINEVSCNYKEWIEKKLYPKSIQIPVVNEFSPTGYGSKLSYILIDKILK